MPSYSTPEAVAGFLKDFQMRINHQKKGTFSPAHVRYFLTISRYGKEKYGEDFADCADNFIQDNDDIAGRVNPCAMSVETVRAVYGMGFDAVFLNDWKKELAECDIDPEAVSVDSEAHDMENGRDGLDGNAPEKDAPEKDDRDAQPPVDTDNR